MSERDIVERLENEAKVFEQTLLDETVDLIREAAAEIARLREENRLLIADRKRFPDKPPEIGRIIDAYNSNRDAVITDLENRCRIHQSEIARLRKERPEIVPPGMWTVCNDNQTNIAWQPFLDDLFAKRDAEWIRAIAAANGRVKEVPRE